MPTGRPTGEPVLRPSRALALGLLHGPAERTPVSSSAHTTLVPWLLRWPGGRADAAAHKRLEVALHAGATAALLVRRRTRTGPPARVVVLACLPPALAGALLQRPIERRLGTPATIAAALAGGSFFMAAAERRRHLRSVGDARAGDGLALGLAQALALIPGVSRSGATRAVARWRGFAPREALALSDAVGLPITLGAIALKGREALADTRDGEGGTLAAGAAGAFASTLLSDAALRHGGRSLYPYAAYRIALAAAVVRRLRQNPPR